MPNKKEWKNSSSHSSHCSHLYVLNVGSRRHRKRVVRSPISGSKVKSNLIYSNIVHFRVNNYAFINLYSISEKPFHLHWITPRHLAGEHAGRQAGKRTNVRQTNTMHALSYTPHIHLLFSYRSEWRARALSHTHTHGVKMKKNYRRMRLTSGDANGVL